MTPPPVGALAEALERNRARLNAQFDRHSRILRKPVDPEEFSAHLKENVAPVAEAVASYGAGKVDRVVEEIFGVSLELMGAGCLGPKSRFRWPGRLFQELFPAAAPFIAQNPRLVAASLLNAAITLETEPSARAGEWLGRMKSAAEAATTVKDFLDAGMALAWRCGMASYRDGALALIDSMPESLALSLLGGSCPTPPPNRAGLLEELRRKWPASASSDGKRAPIAVCGGFTGFGGPFAGPPSVFLDGGAIAATDGAFTFDLFADRFGAMSIKRAEAKSGAKIPGPDREATAFVGAAYPFLKTAKAMTKSWAWDGATLAVSLTVSHKIFLFALPRP